MKEKKFAIGVGVLAVVGVALVVAIFMKGQPDTEATDGQIAIAKGLRMSPVQSEWKNKRGEFDPVANQTFGIVIPEGAEEEDIEKIIEKSVNEQKAKSTFSESPYSVESEVLLPVKGARALAFENSILYVSTGSQGKVIGVRLDKDLRVAKHSKPIVVSKGLGNTIGLDIKADHLVFSDYGALHVVKSALSNFEAAEKEGKHDFPVSAIVSGLPDKKHHGGKYLRISDDMRVFYSVGAPCNVCETSANEGIIASVMIDGTDRRLEARGVRNSVGFDFHPVSRNLWFTSNGADEMGEDIPPDILTEVTSGGEHFGFPYCHAGYISDNEFGDRRSCEEFAETRVLLGAHNAPLGVKFITEPGWPDSLMGSALVAEHGSWNRTKKSGYRLSLVKFDGLNPVDYTSFVEGWKDGEDVKGRPADVLVMPDGIVLVSDDHAGVVYRLKITEKK